MGRDLHYSVVPFFEKCIKEHSSVRALTRIDQNWDDHYIYNVERHGMRDVVIQLSDAYRFTEFDFYNKSNWLAEGGIICIIRPEGGTCFEPAIESKIFVGKISPVMGALRKDKFWTYVPKARK